MKTFPLVFIAALILVVVSMPRSEPAHASTKDGAETLKQLESEFMKAAAERGSQGYMSYYADEAVEVPNGADTISGKPAIAKTMGFLDDKNNHLTWIPVGADMSSSGDLGYTYGTFEFRSLGKNGKTEISHGKYTSIWKKQNDGSWKVVLDMGNSSPEQNDRSAAVLGFSQR
ncbi:MAG TPA: DUF4440 domain-containing protein [Candidatus Sulfotelmatobacter sp.]